MEHSEMLCCNSYSKNMQFLLWKIFCRT